MKVTVKIGTVEVTVDRQNFKDDGDHQRRTYIMRDTVIPTLDKVVEKAKELYQLQKQNPSD
jgi:hypothetical protein